MCSSVVRGYHDANSQEEAVVLVLVTGLCM